MCELKQNRLRRLLIYAVPSLATRSQWCRPNCIAASSIANYSASPDTHPQFLCISNLHKKIYTVY
jgi:hypothetical protein